MPGLIQYLTGQDLTYAQHDEVAVVEAGHHGARFLLHGAICLGATAAGRRDPPGLLGSDVGLQAAEARGLNMLPG